MPIFSDKELQKHVDKLDAEEGHTLNVGAELEPGDCRPDVTVEYQGEHDGEQVDVTWAAYLKSQFTKATTAIGAKVGFKW